jgi:hypothetical protein
MNAYRTQYWLWASLNKRFGKAIRLKRDDLHRVYEVNRHGFEVSTKGGLLLQEVYAWFQKFLNCSGFKQDLKESTWYEKVVERKRIFISMRLSKGLNGEESINVFLRVYQV